MNVQTLQRRSTSVMSAVLLGTLFCSLAGIAQAEDSSTYDTTLRSTTWVLAKNSEGTSSGTGVLIDLEKKLIITNAHVVGDARAAVIFFPDITNGKPVVKRQHYLDNVTKLGIRGRVLAIDRKRDLALIELEKLPADATAIEMAAESIGPGQKVESIGNPGSTEALWVYTSGTVRAVYRKQFRTGAGEHDFMVVDTQSPINSGDSGGPVVNSQGQLVAIAQAIAPNARLVSYSVDITEVKTFMASPWKPAPLPVADVLKNAELTYKQHATGHYEIEMELTKDQKETVFVTKDIEYYERVDVRKIWALAQSSKEAPKAEIAMKLLEQNARTKLGAWTIEKTEAGEHLIIYMVKLDATATPDVTKSAIEYVARLTQAMKKELNPSKDAQSASDTLNAWLSN